MFYIQSFKVKNFKAFRESPAIELRPLTVLSGVNSSGKSSFIQGLLLLKQTLEKESFPRLKLTGKADEIYVEFAPFEEAIFKYAPLEDRQLEFEIQVFTDMPEEPMRLKSFKRELPEPVVSAEKTGTRTFPLALYTKIRFRYDDELGAVVDFLECQAFCGFAVGPYLKVTPNPEDKDFIIFKSQADDWQAECLKDVSLRWSGILPSGLIFPQKDRLERGVKHGWGEKKLDYSRIMDEFTPIMAPLQWLRFEIERKFSYLESLRPRPLSLYLIDPNPPLSVSALGESPFQKLWHDKEKRVHAITPEHGVEERELLDAVNQVLAGLGIEQPLSIYPEGSLGFQIRFQTKEGRESVSIPHVGFGISQVLPIILSCLESKPGDTIIIDHPEIHLHPNAQARLADYFIALINAGRRLIVETHSQYFINRLVRRAAEQEGLADKINILFVRQQEGEKGATIAPLEINEDGDISNWPADFFPEPDEDIAKTLTAKFRRSKQ